MGGLRRALRRVSLRTKLVALMAVLMMAGIMVTAWGTAQTTKAALMGQVDADLRSNRTELADAMDYAVAQGLQDMSSSSQRTFDYYGALYDEHGTKIFENGRLGATSVPVLPAVTPAQVEEQNRQPFSVRGTGPASRGWRVLAVPDTSTHAASMVIAYPLDATVDIVDRSSASILLTGTLATMVVSMIAYAVTTRAFRPLLRVERTASAIAAGDLTQRIEEYPIETEVGRLSWSLNQMLAQIESAFRAKAASETKMRRFIQDASHELRTPLVTIRGYSELYRHGGIPQGEPLDSAIGRIEGEAKRMSQLVEDLLTLARLDEERPLDSSELDLLVLANDAVADARVNAPEREVRLVGIDGTLPMSAPTFGDEARLRQVIVNLMTNALRYTPEGSPIEVGVGVRPVIEGRSDAVLAIIDHGPGIPEADAARIFERFYRADSSRHRETGGTGLGLAIVAAIASQHDGSIRLSETPGGGTTMALHVPLVEPTPKDVPQEPASAPESGRTGALARAFRFGSRKDTPKPEHEAPTEEPS